MRLKLKPKSTTLTLPEVKKALNSRASRIAANAGEGYEARESMGRTRRARAVVVTATPEAMRDNSRNQTLSRYKA
ncbi:hypothetical protein [Dermabacter hominis]|uniref:hypothetical protein n=1 Tax=Dermabacter hominis TaxID=36740 RepID=UPI002A475AEC|nr:hypothetical protein [Dermabacter hominis]